MKNDNQMIYFTIDCEVYRMFWHVFILKDTPENVYKAVLKKLNLTEEMIDNGFEVSSFCGGGLTVSLPVDGALKNFIWLPEFDFTPEDYNTLVHEAVHASCFTNIRIGLWEETDKNPESLCYLTGYYTKHLIGNITKKLEKQKEKRKCQ